MSSNCMKVCTLVLGQMRRHFSGLRPNGIAPCPVIILSQHGWWSSNKLLHQKMSFCSHSCFTCRTVYVNQHNSELLVRTRKTIFGLNRHTKTSCLQSPKFMQKSVNDFAVPVELSTWKKQYFLNNWDNHIKSGINNSVTGLTLLFEKDYSRLVALGHIQRRTFHVSKKLFYLELEREKTDSEEKSSGTQKKQDEEQPAAIGKKDIIWTIPNALTVSRIILTPFLGYMVLQHYFVLACGMFAYAGITDLLDGFIARRYPSQASSFGSYLDPLADKLLVSVLFVTLTMVDLIPVMLTGLIVLRDVILIIAAFYVRFISLPPPITLRRYFDVTHATAQLHPTFISKLNTAVQLGLVATTLATSVLGCVDHVAVQFLWYITAGTTIASGITYMFAKDTFKIIRESKHKKNR